jgi:hypothetical protein
LSYRLKTTRLRLKSVQASAIASNISMRIYNDKHCAACAHLLGCRLLRRLKMYLVEPTFALELRRS